MTTSVVIGGIFLSSNQLFGMEQLAVSTSSDFVNDSLMLDLSIQVRDLQRRYVGRAYQHQSLRRRY
jgi:hypothetical protein